MGLVSLHLDSIGLQLDGQMILSNLSIDLKPGIHCFLGPNGAGKTMTNRTIALIEEITNGRILWNDIEVNPFIEGKLDYIRKIGYMRQEPVFLNRSVRDNVSVPLNFRNVDPVQQQEQVQQILDEFDLIQFADRSIHKLSTGQRQRVALARTMITQPELVILDEPTASLDVSTTKWFENYILTIQQKTPRIVIWTTHDQFQAKRLADTVSILIGGKIRSSGSVNQVLSHEQDDPLLQRYLEGELVEF